jgi:CubicO group peptidase (beta-lactamase class C family)
MTISLTPAALSAVDEMVSDYFVEGRAPGMVYGVAIRGQLVHWKAIGDAVIGERKCDRNTAFRVASMTKSFTAMAILKLRDRGLINLDAPFVQYIPDLYPQQIELFEVTVRQLLTMSGGFPTDDPWADRLESASDADLLELMSAGFRFDSRPGTRFEYSNLGYVILGRIVANVTKMSFIEYVTQEIFFSLGLRNTTFDYQDSPTLAMGYANIDGWVREEHTSSGSFSPLAGIITTVDDLVAWTHYLSSAFEPSEPELGPLKKSSRREMQGFHEIIPLNSYSIPDGEERRVNGYGFGLRVEENARFGKIAGHTGGYPGFGSHMAWNVETGVSIIAMANGRYANPVLVTMPALRSLLATLPTKEVDVTRELEFMREKVVALFNNWDEKSADTFFALNMDMDYPREYRRKKIDEAIAQTGALKPTFDVLSSRNASHLKWIQHGEKKNLQITMLLAPLAPVQIEILEVSVLN